MEIFVCDECGKRLIKDSKTYEYVCPSCGKVFDDLSVYEVMEKRRVKPVRALLTSEDDVFKLDIVKKILRGPNERLAFKYFYQKYIKKELPDVSRIKVKHIRKVMEVFEKLYGLSRKDLERMSEEVEKEILYKVLQSLDMHFFYGKVLSNYEELKTIKNSKVRMAIAIYKTLKESRIKIKMEDIARACKISPATLSQALRKYLPTFYYYRR